MATERQTRRQKDISRLRREQIERIRTNRGALKRPEAVSRVRKEAFPHRLKKEIQDHGLNEEEVLRQIDLLKTGPVFVKLVRPARLKDGINTIREVDHPRLIALHEEAMNEGRMLKFVPASGAATRMFQNWYNLMAGNEDLSIFWTELKHLPFYSTIKEALQKRGWDIEDPGIRSNRSREILEFILNGEGLNYGNLPKALIPFHEYGNHVRTAVEEHLVEAAMYIRDAGGLARLHITVQRDHEKLMEDFLSRVKPDYEKKYDVSYEITFSSQSPSTDTVALDAQGRLFRDKDGKVVFRPGGHGALLQNLSALKGDIVFVKNIDNVTREEYLPDVVRWHKLMGGFLIEKEREIYGLLNGLEEGKIDPARAFLEEVLLVKMPEEFHQVGDEGKKKILYDLLHRPIRVCGMVRNEGEPGGGPFWVEMPNGNVSLQIVEEVQVNPLSERQRGLWCEATHFNPVDMVLGLRDEKGEPYDLNQFVEPRMAIVTRKTHQGKPIRIVEHPGLWNGGMAGWITFFVEIPISTFNPVKTYADLLRPAHQPG